MLHHIAPRSTTQAQAMIMPFEGEDVSPQVKQATAGPTSLYTLAVIVRVGLVAAILLRALALWQ